MKDNKILLLRRFNTGYEDGNYSFIAGHVDQGETFSETIIREAKEEAGIDIRREDLEVVHVMHRKSTLKSEERICIFMTTEKWQGEIKNMEPHKCDDLRWFDLDDLPENTIPYVVEFLRCFIGGGVYSEYGWRKEVKV